MGIETYGFTVLLTQLMATAIAVFGIFLTPISLTTAGLIWGYVIIAFFLTDAAKVLYYKIRDGKNKTNV